MIKFAIIFTLILAFCDAKAQMPEYYVFLIKGNAIKLSNAGKPTVLIQKDFIYNNDRIELKNGAEITLVDKNNKYYVLNKVRIYTIHDLKTALGKGNSTGITEKYFMLLWNELLNPNHDAPKDNSGGVYGGVERNALCNKQIFPVEGLKSDDDFIHFRWLSTGANETYTLQIYDENKMNIYKQRVLDTTIKVSLKQLNNPKPGKYFWYIKNETTGCESDPSGFEHMVKGSGQEFLNSIGKTKPGSEILDQLKIISKLEKEKWIYVASRLYKNLSHSNAGDKALAKSYNLFLEKYGLATDHQ